MVRGPWRAALLALAAAAALGVRGDGEDGGGGGCGPDGDCGSVFGDEARFAAGEINALDAACRGSPLYAAAAPAAGPWELEDAREVGEPRVETFRVYVSRPERRAYTVPDPATGEPVERYTTVVVPEERDIDIARSVTLALALRRGGEVRRCVATVTCHTLEEGCALTRLTSADGPLPNDCAALPGDGGAGAAGGGPGADAAVRAASVNVWNYNHWRERLPLLREELEGMRADLVGFQELRCRRAGGPGRSPFQVADVSRMLPAHQFAFVPAMTFREGARELHTEGVAVFSRLPVEEVGHVRLTRNASDGDDFHQRVCAWARVRVGGRRLLFASTHLSLSDAARRRTLDEIGEFAAAAGLPVVLVGDFNAESAPGARPSLLTRHGFRDAWAEARGEAEADGEAGHTFGSWSPSKRIDYVMSRGMRAVAAGTAGTRGREGAADGLPGVGGVDDLGGVLHASDHFFPHADLRFADGGDDEDGARATTTEQDL